MKEENPKVSVIMTAFNEEKYINAAIQSILGQSYQNFELIVVDDASTDNTSQFLEQYNDKRLRVITNEVNRGWTYSRNKAIKLAKGHYIAIQDADDISKSQRLERQVKFLENNLNIGLVGSFCQMISEDTGKRYTLTRPLMDSHIRRAFIRMNPFIHSSIMFRKCVLDEVGLYNSKYQFEDYELCLRITSKFKVANISEVLVIRNEHANQEVKKLPLLRRHKERTRIELKAVHQLSLPAYYYIRIIPLSFARLIKALYAEMIS